ncbi:small integral membrane protein 14 [Aethina tumida]|uniref:small integral membrane protein 14 n=1 Tax=Aethina tumida TaxID=116153 RepID=UPI002148E0D1|nr:small integral membrane protein 14 [Aethina tumida]XP_049823347.1 small integral membrane protein 14 [Aethina tumida]
MGDQGVDPCECIWGHEMAMRRLLNLLRNSQSYCTDTTCFDDGTTPNTGQNDNFMLMGLMFVAALLLCYFRPTSQRVNDSLTKPNNGNDSNGSPPTPPAVN